MTELERQMYWLETWGAFLLTRPEQESTLESAGEFVREHDDCPYDPAWLVSRTEVGE